MIVLLDTSTAVCRFGVATDSTIAWHEWDAGRQLAKGLLRYMTDTLAKSGHRFQDITGVGVLRGPGSFTGLRIGLTVANTLAESLAVPIVGGEGADWETEVLRRIRAGQNDTIVLPEYGGEAHITKPRK